MSEFIVYFGVFKILNIQQNILHIYFFNCVW